MDQTEIQARIETGRARGRERKEELSERNRAARALAKEDSDYIKGRGYRLDYDFLSPRVLTVAYKWDFVTGETDLYFTIKSTLDQFSKRDARASLREHMELGTHHLQFKCGTIERRIFQRRVINQLRERVLTHGNEFPRYVKRLLRQSPEQTNAQADVLAERVLRRITLMESVAGDEY